MPVMPLHLPIPTQQVQILKTFLSRWLNITKFVLIYLIKFFKEIPGIPICGTISACRECTITARTPKRRSQSSNLLWPSCRANLPNCGCSAPTSARHRSETGSVGHAASAFLTNLSDSSTTNDIFVHNTLLIGWRFTCPTTRNCTINCRETGQKICSRDCA